MDHEGFNQIIQELKAIREEKQISLQTISEKTRIRLQYLEWLESGALDKLPQVYDRFIFKSYLQQLGIENWENYLQQFDALRRPPAKTTTVFHKKVAGEKKEFISKAQLLKIVYGGIPLLIIIFLVWLLMRSNSAKMPEKEPPVKELTAQEIVKEVQAQKKQEVKPSPKMSDSLEILLKAHDKSWVRYVKDHSDTSDFILKGNNVIKIVADSVVEFTIGAPSVVTLQMDTLTYAPLGKQGEVISYMKVTRQGIVKKRVVKPRIKNSKNRSNQSDSTQTR